MARVSKAKITQELKALEAIVREHPEGISRAEIGSAYEKASGQTMEGRTLGRRLADLVEANGVKVNPAGPRTRYYPIAATTAGGPKAPGAPEKLPHDETPDADDYTPVSAEGAQVRALVRRPLSVRPPVGYQPQFLEGYKPGVTWYLPSVLRTQLLELGRTPDSARPAGTYAREILGQLLIDLAWGSSRLEGNTYSRLDTKNLIEFGQQAGGKNAKDAQMILNHRAAIEMLVEDAEHIGFNRYTFFNLHALLSENLLDDPGDEGGLRDRLVGIDGSSYTPPGIPQKIEEWFDLFLEKAGAIPDPFEQAFFVMVQLPYLQPFVDVNKRTSRLGANIPLIRANLLPLSFVDVSERAYVDGLRGVYEFNRVELLRDAFAGAYERSVQQYRVVREAMGEPDPLRLRYRTELREVVRETVLSGEPPKREALRAWAVRQEIDLNDVDAFAERALDLLLALREHTAARYRLRPSEFLAWKARATTPSRPRPE
jgi:hypothetical protein